MRRGPPGRRERERADSICVAFPGGPFRWVRTLSLRSGTSGGCPTGTTRSRPGEVRRDVRVDTAGDGGGEAPGGEWAPRPPALTPDRRRRRSASWAGPRGWATGKDRGVGRSRALVGSSGGFGQDEPMPRPGETRFCATSEPREPNPEASRWFVVVRRRCRERRAAAHPRSGCTGCRGVGQPVVGARVPRDAGGPTIAMESAPVENSIGTSGAPSGSGLGPSRGCGTWRSTLT